MQDPEPIECNGRVLEVQQNLATALRWLRFTDRPRLLWIDAICINQKDEKEKSIQIQNMFTIFYRAEKGTIAWLGEKRECGFEAFRFLQESSVDQRHGRECVRGLVHIVRGMHAHPMPEEVVPADLAETGGLCRQDVTHPSSKRNHGLE
jgi:hypothetical protein